MADTLNMVIEEVGPLNMVIEEEGPLSMVVEQGPPGEVGEPGLSAYEVAVTEGFVGTEAEWLDSLVGAPGSTTIAGITGLQADLDALTAADAAEAATRASADSAEAATRASAVSGEASTRASADNTLQTNITSEASTRASAITTEATARAAGDATNATAITTEATARAAAVTAEASARATADTTEATARAAGDATNATAITTEASTRAAADSAQVARLDALEAGSGSGGSDGTLLVGDGVPDASLGIQGDSYLDRTTGDVYRKWSKPAAWSWDATGAELVDLAAAALLLVPGWEGTGHPKDLVSGSTLTRPASVTWATQNGMPVLRFSGAGDGLHAPAPVLGAATAWTFVAVLRVPGATPSDMAVYDELGAAGADESYVEPVFVAGNGAGVVGLATDSYAASTDPQELFAQTVDQAVDLTGLRVVVTRRNGATATMMMDGRTEALEGSPQDNIAVTSSTQAVIGVTSLDGVAFTFSPLIGDLAFLAVWDTARSDAELLAIARNPFGVARQAGADLTAEPGIWAKVAELATQAELDAEAGTRGAADTTLAGRATALEAVAPTANQKAALAGTGTPSGTDKYVNNSDARMTDARTPSAHTHPESDVTGLATDLAGKQALHANLTALAGLVGASDRAFYFTGSGALSLYTLTTFGRTLAALADAAALRTAGGLVIGTDVQAFHANLTALAGLSLVSDRLPYANGTGTLALATYTSFARTWDALADAAAGRTALSLGTAALISSTAGGDLAGTLPSPTVAKITTTTGPTSLTIGAVADGETLKRSGSSVIGYTPSGGVALGSATPLVDATAGAAGSSSNAAKDDHVHPAGGLHRHVFVSGWYHFPAGNTATINATLNRQYYIPFPVYQACTVTAIACSVTTLGAAGAVVRLGIYNSDANGLPGTLLIDGGTVASTGTGAKEVTISQALTPGIYWLAVVPQVVTCSLTALVGVNAYGALGSPSNQAATPIGGYFEAGITGALANRAASDATLGGNFQSNVPRVGLKVTVP